MAITYTELTAAIQDYLSDAETSFVAYIDRFIRVTENRLLFSIQVPDQRSSATLTTVASTSTLAAPAGFLAVHSLALSSGSTWEFLLQKDVNFMDQFNPSRSEGVPRFYGLKDAETFIFSPIPDGSYSINLEFYKQPESIVDTGTTSWLGDNAENALLYGCLVEAYTYLKGEPDLIQLYESRFKEAVNGLVELGLGKDRRDDYRNKRARIASK